MASLTAGLLLAYLLSTSFTDEVELNISPVEKLVDYSYDFGFAELIPGISYNGTINAAWAVPDSALLGLEGKSIAVKITATAQNNSSIQFPSMLGEQKTAEAFLICDVQDNTCANSSVLSVQIPVLVLLQPGESEQGSISKISLKSEIVEASETINIEKEAGRLFETLKNALGENQSQNNSSGFSLPNISLNQSNNGNLLDSLKPEGDSNDPIDFLRKNPLISLAALVIVIITTGAYLLNAKD